MEKACAVVLRKRHDPEILVFMHPLAVVQIVKGSVEPGESVLDASERELREEAGIALKAQRLLCAWQRLPQEPTWGICLMEEGRDLPEEWSHFCEDHGRHTFGFFWHPLSQTPDERWHPLFTDALSVIRQALADSIPNRFS
jgi:8-oxo-dGTP pyrophosphatase MutT (NUDIX family)